MGVWSWERLPERWTTSRRTGPTYRSPSVGTPLTAACGDRDRLACQSRGAAANEEAMRRDRGAGTDSTISPRAPGPNRMKGTKAAERVRAGGSDVRARSLRAIRLPAGETAGKVQRPIPADLRMRGRFISPTRRGHEELREG